MDRRIGENDRIPGFKGTADPRSGDGNTDIHAAGTGTDFGVEHARLVGAGRNGQWSFLYRTVAKRHPRGVICPTTDMDLVLVDAAGEIKMFTLGKNIPLDEHRVNESRLAENPFEKRQHTGVSAKPVQFLIGP